VRALDRGEHQRGADPLALAERVDRHDLEDTVRDVEREQSDPRPVVVLRHEPVELGRPPRDAVTDDDIIAPAFDDDGSRPIPVVRPERPHPNAHVTPTSAPGAGRSRRASPAPPA
jgi:hypothetical protein